MGTEGAKTFSLAQVVAVFGPSDLKAGAGEGDWLKITPNADKIGVVEGQNGEVLFTYTGTRLYKVEITLLQSSKTNDYLSAVQIADEKSLRAGNGGILLPFFVKDTGGTLAFASPKARVSKVPDFGYGNKNMDRVWTILAADGELFVGGN